MFSAALFLLSLYYTACIGLLWRGLRRLAPGLNKRPHTFSVVIAARNEERFLGRCLESVLRQNVLADRYEVIVVDDRSTDRTGAVVRALQPRHANLHLVAVTECPAGLSPKKNALQQGIASAKNEILLFTDADCIVPATWIAAVDRSFEETTGVAAGPTSYHRSPGTGALLFGLQSMDFFSHAVVAAGAIGAGFPLNTNANNFAVRRCHFDEIGGFDRVASVVSGDDDLLLQAVSRLRGVRARYALSHEAAVTTEPTTSFSALWEQRKRWSSKTVYYNRAQTLYLSGIFLYYALILLGLLLSPFCHALFAPSLAAFVLKTVLDFFLAFSGMVRFQKYDVLPWFFPLAAVHIPLIVGACCFGIFGKFRWKDGRVGKKLEAVGR